jgi:disulfide bond formation protein DsbB
VASFKRTAAALDRLILLAMFLVLAAILTAAMVMQYAFGEIPCPLCLLQRYAMFGCCFGLAQQIRSDGSERGSGVSLIFAVLLLVIAARQTLLDLFPRPGHDYVGSAILGVHMPVWGFFIAVALIFGFALRFAILGGSRLEGAPESSRLRRLAQAHLIYVVLICTVNFISAIVQCGLGECHTMGYSLLK